MKKSKGEVIADVLEICTAGSSKTHALYRANFSLLTAIPYLDPLTKKGFIAAMNGKHTATDRGKEPLDRIMEAHELF